MYSLTSKHILGLRDSDVAQIRCLLFVYMYNMNQEITNRDKNGILKDPVQNKKRCNTSKC